MNKIYIDPTQLTALKKEFNLSETDTQQLSIDFNGTDIFFRH